MCSYLSSQLSVVPIHPIFQSINIHASVSTNKDDDKPQHKHVYIYIGPLKKLCLTQIEVLELNTPTTYKTFRKFNTYFYFIFCAGEAYTNVKGDAANIKTDKTGARAVIKYLRKKYDTNRIP